MYFDNITTMDGLRAEYRRLIKINHPDAGGDENTMKAINWLMKRPSNISACTVKRRKPIRPPLISPPNLWRSCPPSSPVLV